MADMGAFRRRSPRGRPVAPVTAMTPVTCARAGGAAARPGGRPARRGERRRSGQRAGREPRPGPRGRRSLRPADGRRDERRALRPPPGTVRTGPPSHGTVRRAERRFYARALERAGAAPQGFFVCAADLEDELIRALGVTRVEELVRAEGDLRALKTFLRQPAQRGRTSQQQLAALPRHEEGTQDPLRPRPRRSPRPGPHTRPARRSAHQPLTAAHACPWA